MKLGAERFDFRIIAWLCLATGLTLLPFVIRHAVQGERLVFSVTGALAILLIGVAHRIWKRGSISETLVYTVLFGSNLVNVFAIFQIGEAAIYWAYPVIAANLVFLQPRAGLTLNANFALAVLLTAGAWVPMSELSRIGATLFILVTCVYFFSYYVTQQQEGLRMLAAIDPLTGAGNRRALHASLEEAVESRQRYGCSASLLVLDLDHFKRVNDTHGHDHGDQVLRDLAQLLKRRLRHCDRLFRYGGEEFVILTPHTPLTMAAQLAEDVRLAISRMPGFVMTITASIGVVELQSGESADAWLKRGDEALYQAKAEGRNRSVAHGACSGHRHNPELAVDGQCQSV